MNNLWVSAIAAKIFEVVDIDVVYNAYLDLLRLRLHAVFGCSDVALVLVEFKCVSFIFLDNFLRDRHQSLRLHLCDLTLRVFDGLALPFQLALIVTLPFFILVFI